MQDNYCYIYTLLFLSVDDFPYINLISYIIHFLSNLTATLFKYHADSTQKRHLSEQWQYHSEMKKWLFYGTCVQVLCTLSKLMFANCGRKHEVVHEQKLWQNRIDLFYTTYFHWHLWTGRQSSGVCPSQSPHAIAEHQVCNIAACHIAKYCSTYCSLLVF